MAIHRAPQEGAGGGRRILSVGLPIVLVVAVVAAAVVFLNEPAQTNERDSALCPIGEGAISARAVLLLDLGKPWNDDAAELLAQSIGQVAAELPRDAELRVFALSGTAAEPRQSLDRFCKPYDERELAAGEGCGNLPAALAEHDAAAQFCVRADTLGRRAARSAARRQGGQVANAYLVEAIEETSLEFAEASGTKSLFILSDMVQHAPWFSQAERTPASLNYSAFEQLRSEQSRLVGPRPAPLADIDVTIFYVPRSGVTEDSRQRQEHKRFWQEYVASAFATAPIFHDLPAMPPFEALPFADGSASEVPNAEWESLQREREEAERLLEVVERERVALEEARVAALERAEELEREAERRQRELAAAEAAAEAEAEQRRREIAAAELAAASPVVQQPAGTSPEALSSPAPANITFAGVDRESVSDQPPASESSADLAAAPTQDAVSPEPPTPSASEAQPPPSPLAQPELPPIAATVVDAPTVGGLAPCPLVPKPRFQGATPEYPERARPRFGEATITVSFVVDEQGNTVDNAVSVVESQSTARPERLFDMFADQASEFVQRLEFDFEADAGCARRQERATTYQFNYR